MEKDFKPDFGLLILKLKGENARYWFLPFKIYHIGRVSDNLYSTTSDVQYNDTTYAATIDFSKDMYKKLLALIPDVPKNLLVQTFKRKFTAPHTVELPSPITIGIGAKLGKVTETANGKDTFVPFRVTEVFRMEDLARGKVKIE